MSNDKKILINISGLAELPGNISLDEFTRSFIRFIESQGGEFGGEFNEVDEDGNSLGTIGNRNDD